MQWQRSQLLKKVRLVNIYASKTGVLKYIKQILTDLKEEIDSNTVMVGFFNIPLSTMNRWPRQKNSNGTLNLKYMLDHMKLTDIYRTFFPTAAECRFFLNAHATFCRIVSMFDHKTIFKSSRKLKSYQTSFLTTWNVTRS